MHCTSVLPQRCVSVCPNGALRRSFSYLQARWLRGRGSRRRRSTVLIEVTLVLCILWLVWSALPSIQPPDDVVQLQPERTITLRLGELATIEVASEAQYSIGAAGDALVFVEKRQRGEETVFVYRAAYVGKETLVAAPNALSGPCVSCVARRYFVEVVPSQSDAIDKQRPSG